MYQHVFCSKQRGARRLSAAKFSIAILTFAPAAFSAGANSYTQHNLVADVAGVADHTDPNLLDPWGLCYSATSPFWVSNHRNGTAGVYQGNGTVSATAPTVPAATGSGPGTPTGQVQNNTTGFLLANGKAASFIFSTEDGTIAAWNGGTAAATMANNSSTGAVYKGLAIANPSTGPLLYASNFNSGNIDVFDTNFKATTVPGGFKDSNVPAGFAPFNIWNIGGKLYVSYAQQDANKFNDVAGPGNGYVAIFDTGGNLLTHLISGGALNSPWGMAIAPATFGAFGGALLVGNFGNGHINAFDPMAGTLLGTLQDPTGAPITLTGLWALLFGNGGSGGDVNYLYFTAGVRPGTTPAHGLLGSLAPPSAVLSVVNGASGTSGPIAPGEVVIINGVGMGPVPVASATIPGSGGTVGTSVSGASVTVGGHPAPVLYAEASEVGIVVPYEISGFSSADIVVTYQGQALPTLAAQPVAFTAPGVFTQTKNGTGAATALNQDGTLNTATNPAPAGSVVLLFVTGDGPKNPPGQDGLVTNDILRTPVLPVSVTIGGQAATVLYAGTTPGFVEGVSLVEAVVPTGAGTGPVPVVVTGNGVSSAATATVALK
jgi:uncharacterized protein (TIGR03118 family)